MRHKRAFTLVELLVVVAILALLAAILSPSLRKAMLLTQRTQCLARQRAIGQGLSNYATNYVDVYPTNWQPGMFADAYGLRRDHPYTGGTDRPPLGLGLLVSTGVLSATGLGDVIHCPSFDNLSSSVAPGHCMDVAHPWGYGGSGWIKYPNHRIIGSYNYRGTSYERVHGGPPRMSKAGASFVVLMDTPDIRMRGERSLYNAHGGYNFVSADGGGSFLADPQYEVDAMALEISGGTVDGRRGASEIIFEYIAAQR